MLYADRHMKDLKIGRYDNVKGPRRFEPDVEDVYYFMAKGRRLKVMREIQKRLYKFSRQNPTQLIAVSQNKSYYQCGDCFVFLSPAILLNPSMHIVNEDSEKRQETLKMLEEILK